MRRFFKIFAVLCLFSAWSSTAIAQRVQGEVRGELLYMAHCSTCHSTQIHWREQKLARNWENILQQVRRWQYISGLNWSEGEITDVAQYLNIQFYKYKSTVQSMTPIRLIELSK
jgi:mono/diheme cytochrome c family protein